MCIYANIKAMESLKSVFIENWPNLEICKNHEDYEDASDFRCQSILNYPLIFTSNNKIIFWGFEVELAKNEYDLLKNLVYLHTNNLDKLGFLAEEILKDVKCDRENKSLNRIVTELKSEIKCRIEKEIACHIIRTIKSNCNSYCGNRCFYRNCEVRIKNTYRKIP